MTAFAPVLIFKNYRLAVGRIIKPAYGRVGKVAQRFRAPAIDEPKLAGGLQSAAGVEIPLKKCSDHKQRTYAAKAV